VTRLVDEHAAGDRDHSRRLWSLLVFSLWHERYAA
jgi:asparagine synthase (glutamine-hydrolysing)